MYRRTLRSIQSNVAQHAGLSCATPRLIATSSNSAPTTLLDQSQPQRPGINSLPIAKSPPALVEPYYRSLWEACSLRSSADATAVLDRMKSNGVQPDEVANFFVQRAGSFPPKDHNQQAARRGNQETLNVCLQDLYAIQGAGLLPPRAMMIDIIVKTYEHRLPSPLLDLILKCENEYHLQMPEWIWLKCLSLSVDHHFEEGVQNAYKRLREMRISLDEGLSIAILHYAFRKTDPRLARSVTAHLQTLVPTLQEHHILPLMLIQLNSCDFLGFWATWHLMTSHGIGLPTDVELRLSGLFFSHPDALHKAIQISPQLSDVRDRTKTVWTNCILRALVAQRQVNKALQFFGMYPWASRSADIQTYNILLEGCCHVRDAENSRALFDQLHEADLLPTQETYEHMVAAFSRAGDFDRAFHWLLVLQDSGYTPSCLLCQELLWKCTMANDGRAREIRDIMLNHGYEVS